MELITHRKHAVNITETERMLSVMAGGILALTGFRKKSIRGLALTLAGADLVRRGITGHSYIFEMLGIRTARLGQGAETTSVPYELGIRVDHSITINRPRADVYRFWRDLTNLPRFMNHIKSVRLIGDNRSHWVVKGPGTRFVEWDAVIHNEIENELIAWRTLPSSEVDHAGSVWFKDAAGGRGTEIRVELQYSPPAGVVGAVLARFRGEEPTQQIEADLRNLKQILEAGEAVRVDGPPNEPAPPRAETLSGGSPTW
jgi:uncharacterized membrane protein